MNRFIRLLLVVLALGILPCSVLAADLPEQDKSGSISVQVDSGGTMTLYQVAEYAADRNAFVTTALFEDSGFDQEDLSADAAVRLWAFIVDAKDTAAPLLGVTKDITGGAVTYANLPLGVYLLAHEGVSGMPEVLPFFVTVPMREDGAFVYDVTANSKVRLPPSPPPEPSASPLPSAAPSTPPEVSPSAAPEPGTSPEPSPSMPTASPEPGPSTPPDTSPEPGVSPAPSTAPGGTVPSPAPSAGSKLPYTGQPNWPIPVLVVFGLLLFSLGWSLRQKKGK